MSTKTKTKPLSEMTDSELRAAVRTLLRQNRPMAELREAMKPYLEEVKVRITRETGHVFKTH